MAKLVLIPTPIGNLEDITLRAIRILKEASIILCEDTRVSAKLCHHFEINTPLRAFHQHNEHKQLGKVIQLIEENELVVLVSDAGTPAISDPGFLLVRECIKEGIEVETLPGATAFVPALVNSGFPCDKFVFEGFLPHKKGRQKRLKELAEETRSIIFYESPYRLVKLLEEIKEHIGVEKKVSVSREISKIYEETIRGIPDELIEHFTENGVKGEIVVIIN